MAGTKGRPKLETLLCERGLAADLKEARALVLAGKVLSGDTLLSRASDPLDPEAPLRVRGRKAFASRAGLKLEAALDRGGIRVEGLRCLDLGASTGGFTDCLLRRGAAGVLSVDVGSGQLAWALRSDPRVVSREGLDYRHLKAADIPRPLGFACADLAFTSVKPVFAYLASWLAPGAAWAVLVKPQFEVHPSELGPRGIVRDETLRQRVLAEALQAAQEAGLEPRGHCESPLAGAKGNREWLLWGGAPP
ncbi:MAG TPA: TlyA family RNA methyltransferase [bacterium]|jgi:23S rRNA (cytidine1920-2'-O)/16S rRNA (cytidine1409-2'-O)-methyltransferase|nr:TlyA family RNA methyltransferase [bacterium]